MVVPDHAIIFCMYGFKFNFYSGGCEISLLRIFSWFGLMNETLFCNEPA